MGANSSRSTEGKNHGDLENRKSSRRISYRLKWKRRAPSIDLIDQDETCDTSSVKSGSLASSVASTTATTRENEKSEIRNSTLQRMLPSIPGTAKESDSDLGKLAHHTDSRCDGAPELVRQSSSQRAEDDGTEAQAFTDEKEDPDRNVDDAASTFESADVTYMQINSSDVTCISQTDRLIAPSETNENNGVPEALVNNNEGEDAALYQVITPNLGNDYVRTDFNINAAGTNAQTTKTQAIVGPTSSSGPRVHAGVFLYPVQPETKLTLKMKASILMKTDFRPDWCWINVRVVLGYPEDEIARQKTMEKLQMYMSEGFRMLDSMEFDLFAGESRSTVSVKISKIQWMPDGDITHGDIDNEEFGLHHLWNHGFAEAMFWQWSQITSGVKPKAFAATVHIQQDDRQDMRKKIFYLLESPLPYNEKQHIPVNDYTMIQRRCDKLAKDFPSCVSLGVAVPTAVPPRSSCCSSEYKYEVDLHSDNSVPGVKAAVLVESLDRHKKNIETEGAVKL